MEEITYEHALNLDNILFVDVRSPGEFEIDHIPGAVNLPIFNDEERKEVGTLYKLAGREEAVIRGTEIGGKRIGDIINALSEAKDRDIVISCARGGMRSGAVSSLLNSLGIKSFRLKEGYRAYRRYVMDILNTKEIRPQIFTLQGFTGAGKTEILRHINNSIDIEGLAGHRSSVFGGIGLKQRSQKAFETGFSSEIIRLAGERYVVIEGESRKVGNLHIPDNVFLQMCRGKALLIETELKTRVDIIKREYDQYQDHENVIAIVESLRNRLTVSAVERLLSYYRSGDIGRFIEILLTEYYDRLYGHSLKKMDFIASIEYKGAADTAEEVVEIIEKYLSGRHFKT